jgi:hypothetical protein
MNPPLRSGLSLTYPLRLEFFARPAFPRSYHWPAKPPSGGVKWGGLVIKDKPALLGYAVATSVTTSVNVVTAEVIEAMLPVAMAAPRLTAAIAIEIALSTV